MRLETHIWCSHGLSGRPVKGLVQIYLQATPQFLMQNEQIWWTESNNNECWSLPDACCIHCVSSRFLCILIRTSRTRSEHRRLLMVREVLCIYDTGTFAVPKCLLLCWFGLRIVHITSSLLLTVNALMLKIHDNSWWFTVSDVSPGRYWTRAVSGGRYLLRQCADKNCKCRSPDMLPGMIKVLKCGLSVNSLCAVKLWC